MDVADARVRALPAELEAKLGPLDILVNNAGVVRGGPIPVRDYEAAWDFHVAREPRGASPLIRAFLPQLLRERAGRIINIASTEGSGPPPREPIRRASTASSASRARSRSSSARGVTVNCICPGPIRTRHDGRDPRGGSRSSRGGACRCAATAIGGGRAHDALAGAAAASYVRRGDPRGRRAARPEHLSRAAMSGTSLYEARRRRRRADVQPAGAPHAISPQMMVLLGEAWLDFRDDPRCASRSDPARGAMPSASAAISAP
jgi:NAD(P)-dependent dehydrogenase (short-subunit alcohol dehydrogenase family)